MEKAISVADANRKFSQVLREVRQGHSYIVTSPGQAVARIAPVKGDHTTAKDGRSLLLSRLRSERAVNVGRWKRDDLYE